MALYPRIEYVRVRQDGTEFTTSSTSVTDEMKVLDSPATDRRGNPLPPKSHKRPASSKASGTAKKSEES